MKRIRWALMGLFLTSTLAAAASIPQPTPLTCEADDKEDASCIILFEGGPARTVEGLKLQLIHIQDSRCPLGTVCVWAGFVTTTVAVEALDGSVPAQKIKLSLDPRYRDTHYWIDSATGLTVVLEGVSRAPLRPTLMPLRRHAKIRVGYDLVPDNNLR